MLCGIVNYAIMRILSQNKYAHYIHCAVGRPAEGCAAYTWSYCMCDRSTSKRSVCLAEWYDSLSLERARENYAADVYGLLVSIFSVHHL